MNGKGASTTTDSRVNLIRLYSVVHSLGRGKESRREKIWDVHTSEKIIKQRRQPFISETVPSELKDPRCNIENHSLLGVSPTYENAVAVRSDLAYILSA